MTNKISKADQIKIKEILAKRKGSLTDTMVKQYDSLAGTAEVRHRNLLAHSEATLAWQTAQKEYLAKPDVGNAKTLLKAAEAEQEVAKKSDTTMIRKDRIEGSKQQAIATLDQEIGKGWRTGEINKSLSGDVVVKREPLPKSEVPGYAFRGDIETMADGSTRRMYHMK